MDFYQIPKSILRITLDTTPAGYQLQQADEGRVLFAGGDFEEVQADEEFQEYAGEEFGEEEIMQQH